jgi:hypothetical protein
MLTNVYGLRMYLSIYRLLVNEPLSMIDAMSSVLAWI